MRRGEAGATLAGRQRADLLPALCRGSGSQEEIWLHSLLDNPGQRIRSDRDLQAVWDPEGVR